ncbi:hypothetical protein [Candidatus Palauibacter sp.]|uniref:hypothetical protein n=1 Tax=Candidatus Palauibacter sp. TaxID=3101350 RepID=UPI003C6FFE47
MEAPDSGSRSPFTSFPDGWFLLEFSRDMPAGKPVCRLSLFPAEEVNGFAFARSSLSTSSE